MAVRSADYATFAKSIPCIVPAEIVHTADIARIFRRSLPSRFGGRPARPSDLFGLRLPAEEVALRTLARKVLGALRQPDSERARTAESLTEREQEVLEV